MSEIDWSSELRKIEREFSGLPPEPSAEALRARRAAEQRAQERKNAQAAAVGAWTRLLFVALLAGAINFWPYPRACGAGLFAYLGAAILIVAGGVWVGTLTWRGRMVKAHGLALLMALVGLVLIAAQALPRTGYAKTDPANPPRWSCMSPRP